MTEFVLMDRKRLAAELQSAAIELPKGALSDALPGNVQPTYLSKKPVNWPEGTDKAPLLRALAERPIAQVTSFGLDETEQHFLHRLDDDSSLLFLSMAGDQVRLLAPATAIEVFAAFAELMQPTETAPALPIEWEFTIESLAALFAIIDSFRLLFAASLLQRSGLEMIALGLPELLEQISKGAETPDYRWLCRYLPQLYPDRKAFSEAEIAIGCDQLAAKDLLLKAGSKSSVAYVPSDALINVAYQFLSPLPALMFSSAAAPNGAPAKKAMLISGRTTWYLSCGKKNADLRCLDGLSVLEALQKELHTVISGDIPPVDSFAGRHSPSGDAAATRRDVQQSSAVIERASGAAKEEPNRAGKKFCTKCGAGLALGRNFCTACGAAVQA